MTSSYKRLGDYIQEVNIRNKDLKQYPLLGVSIKKEMMTSIANTVGTDMSTYKIIKKALFYQGRKMHVIIVYKVKLKILKKNLEFE